MPNVLEIMNRAEIITYLDKRVAPQRLGDFLFPNRKTDTLRLEYLLGGGSVPVAATVHAWDSEAQIGSRPGAETMAMDLGLIKRKLPIREQEIIALNNPRTDAELARLVQERFNDVDVLVNGVLARAEAMKMEVLATGQIAIKENGVDVTLDYGIPSDQKIVLAGSAPEDAPWTNEVADVLGQIKTQVEKMASKGFRVTRAVASTSVISMMTNHISVKKAVNGTNTDKLVSLIQLNEVLKENGLPEFLAYDDVYRFQKGDGTYETRRYYPEGYISLIPEGNLGNGEFGPTAEEIEFANDPSVDITQVGNVIAEVYKTTDPVAHWTKAVATFLPSFPAADSVVSIKVK